jgi:hypothetical protein
VSEFFGKRQSELLQQLRQDWLERGRPICVLEGFPGVGKTEIAERLMAQCQRKYIYVACPEGGTDPTIDFLAHLGEELAVSGFPALADIGNKTKLQLDVLSQILSEPLLIVADEFQNTMLGRSGKPGEPLAKFIETLSLDKNRKGRVLILTNRAFERGLWSSRLDLRSFPELDSCEAELLLVDLLTKWDRLDEVPVIRRHEVVERLGKNPRALTTLVHCLTDEPLDNLLGPNREAWEVDDPRISSQLAAKIEEEILQRSMKHLEHESLIFLRRLCVHRQSLRRQALEYFVMPGRDPAALVSDLTQRFMVAQRRGYYEIHPLVHAIAGRRWTAESREMISAHSKAADFYSRPFKAKQLVVSGRTGGQFAELRYHLTKAGRESDLREFRERIIEETSQYWSEATPIPKDTSERDDHITLLSSILVSPGPRKLEIYLGRLLCARGRPDDVDRACLHARRSASALLYLSCSELLAKANFVEKAMALLKEGISKVSPHQSADLYLSCGEMLGEAGRLGRRHKVAQRGYSKGSTDLRRFPVLQLRRNACQGRKD